MALLCLLVVLVACIAAPIHKHDSGQDGNCLICHAAESATVVHVNADAGKPYDPPASTLILTLSLSPIPEPSIPTRSSRAPPVELLPL